MVTLSDTEEETQLSSTRKGGLRTMPFIIVNESFELVGTYGILSNAILYLTRQYNMPTVKAINVLFIWKATSNLIPLVGAFVSDCYFGRFRTISIGSVISFLGMTMLWSTALIPGAKPPPCDRALGACTPATPSQFALLLVALFLMSIGAGGVRPCSMAFGADQVSREDDERKATLVNSFFNWYYASQGVASILGATLIVYILDRMGWKVGLGVPACLMFIAAFMFIAASPLYIKKKAKKSLFTELAQVIVASVKKRHLVLPPKDNNGCRYHSGGSSIVAPTDKLRCLNKTCVIVNPETDLKPDGSASNPWNLCTVEQVEDLKSLIRLIPLWSTGIILPLLAGQHSFIVLQASTMDRHLSSNFQIPAGSFRVFGLLTFTVSVALYDRLLIPVARRITGRPRGLNFKQRMAIGLFIATLATGVQATVESARRSMAIEQGLSENTKAIVNMSAMWLVPQYCLHGLSEAFSTIAQVEFFFSELPRSISSLVVALITLQHSAANLVGSTVVDIIDAVSKKGGGASWVSDNLNKGHIDYYYWVLTVLCCVNFVYFFFCCWLHGPTKEDLAKEEKKEEDSFRSWSLRE